MKAEILIKRKDDIRMTRGIRSLKVHNTKGQVYFASIECDKATLAGLCKSRKHWVLWHD